MIKSELIQRLAEKFPELTQARAERAVNCILDAIAAALAREDRVELRGFGAFSARAREARQGRNPRTGEAVAVKPKRVPFFKAGKELRERVDAARAEDPDARGAAAAFADDAEQR